MPSWSRYVEAVPAQHVHEVARGFRLLEAELAIAEDLVHHLLGELRAACHVADSFLLERGEAGGDLLRDYGLHGEHERDERRHGDFLDGTGVSAGRRAARA